MFGIQIRISSSILYQALHAVYKGYYNPIKMDV